ncbi:MAG: FxsA family protein [Pseudomonadota bacterium]|nr:FxsA family protein [Pseudomonadota bacterium]
MAIVLLSVFIAVPIIEIALFIEIGGWIGLWPTIAVVIVTAFAGTALLRIQGLAVLQRAQKSAERNELPMQEVFDGLCLLMAGVLLLTPGFFTDALGFMFFVPQFRKLAANKIWRWLTRNGHIHTGGFDTRHGSGPSGQGGSRSSGSRVIDGDFEEVDTPPSDRDRLPPTNGT